MLPFVKKMRHVLYGYNIDDDQTVDDKITAVSWCDGANTQLSAIVNENQQIVDERLKIITNKHSAARTAVEQACDLRW